MMGDFSVPQFRFSEWELSTFSKSDPFLDFEIDCPKLLVAFENLGLHLGVAMLQEIALRLCQSTICDTDTVGPQSHV